MIHNNTSINCAVNDSIRPIPMCANCHFTDGKVYTSLPPKCKCIITGKFHNYDHQCDIDISNFKTEEKVGTSSLDASPDVLNVIDANVETCVNLNASDTNNTSNFIKLNGVTLNDMDSLLDIIRGLVLNGYDIKIHPCMKKFSISDYNPDHFEVEYSKSKN